MEYGNNVILIKNYHIEKEVKSKDFKEVGSKIRLRQIIKTQLTKL